MQPLNPELYARLRRISGGHVEVANPGQPLLGTWAKTHGRPTFIAATSGERYRINCPYCQHRVKSDDTRKRLWVSYRWGVPDESGYRFWWAIRCHNENCLEDKATLEAFKSMVYLGMSGDTLVRQMVTPTVVPAEQGPAPWPTDCLPVNRLTLDHPARQYLIERQFDPDEIYEKYQVHYCVYADPPMGAAIGRIIIPVFSKGVLVSWQARYVGQADWKRTAKYYNCPSRSNTQYLYGGDEARGHPFVVLVEGAMNVWRMGPPAAGLFRKAMSEVQRASIRRYWPMAVVMLDEDAERNARAVRDRLHCDMPCCWVPMPKGADPDSMGYERAWAAVTTAIENYTKEL